MFGFLKEKLKNAISKFKKIVEEEPKKKEEAVKKPFREAKKQEAKPVKTSKKESKPAKKEITKPEEKKEETKKPEIKKETIKFTKHEKEELVHKEILSEEKPKEKKSFFSKIKDTFSGKNKEEIVQEEKKPKSEEKPEEILKEENKEESKEEVQKPEEEIKEIEPEKESIQEEELKQEEKSEKETEEEKPEEKKKGFFGKIAEAVTTKPLSEEKFEEIFWDLEIGLLESNVAVEVIDKIREDLKAELVNKKIKFGKTEEVIITTLHNSINSLFNVVPIDLLEIAKKIKSDPNAKRPYVVCFFGVNGSGKTTTIAKLGKMLKKNDISCIIAAADTFRAAAIHQIEEHGRNLDIKIIKHDYGADPAAVAFDAVEHAKAKGKEIVLIDTAGRQHSNANLVDEMKKIIRVVNPDLKIFVGDSLTGNDVVEQAKSFDEAVGIDAIILTKTDVDEKGGAAISVSYVTGKPIIYLGMGQSYEDLKPFDKETIMQSLGLEA